MTARIVLLHSKRVDPERRVQELGKAGYRTEALRLEGGQHLEQLRANPPDAFIIDISSAPATGRDVGIFLRGRKATRRVPLVFVEGEPGKIAATRKLLPDAFYTGWPRIESVLRKALANPPAAPAVPPALAGYSGTPLPKKLGIKTGARVALLGSPAGIDQTLGTLPDGVRLQRRVAGQHDVIVLFARSRRELERRLPVAARALAEGGRLWLSWPKMASGLKTDLSEPVVRRIGMDRELVDYKIAAIDATWSGLCFARRKKAPAGG